MDGMGELMTHLSYWNATDTDFQDEIIAGVPSRRILIIGHAQHGKDTVAEMLRDNYGIRFASSSHFAINKAIWPMVQGRGPWKSAQELYDDRANHREMLYHAIRAYNLIPGPSLAEQMFLEGYDCYVGMRSRDELEKSRSSFSAVVWVDASRRKPLEGTGSMNLGRKDANFVVNNNGDLRTLEIEVDRLADRLGLERIDAST
jgi:hypothetical protein